MSHGNNNDYGKHGSAKSRGVGAAVASMVGHAVLDYAVDYIAEESGFGYLVGSVLSALLSF